MGSARAPRGETRPSSPSHRAAARPGAPAGHPALASAAGRGRPGWGPRRGGAAGVALCRRGPSSPQPAASSPPPLGTVRRLRARPVGQALRSRGAKRGRSNRQPCCGPGTEPESWLAGRAAAGGMEAPRGTIPSWTPSCVI